MANTERPENTTRDLRNYVFLIIMPIKKKDHSAEMNKALKRLCQY
jgi:hypothetical protein